MSVIPVLDMLNGIVVRGIAGRRSEYRPLSSRLTSSVQALDVARALRLQFGFGRLYVADLDAIVHQQINWPVYAELVQDGFRCQIDAGIGEARVAVQILEMGAEPIIGLESCESPEALEHIVRDAGTTLHFSLDLKNGQPICSRPWSSDPIEIVRCVVQAGLSQIIVLDLADVGMGQGGSTAGVCRVLLNEFPHLKLTSGGGARGIEDLDRWHSVGVSGVLVASALHDGTLTVADLKRQCKESLPQP